jgi:micrococcal nuclease
MIRALIVVVVAGALAFGGWWASAGAQGAHSPAACTVRRIIDGDTFECTLEATRVTVRLLGLDAPERGQGPYGAQATRFLARALPVGSSVRLDLDVRERDRYGRLLAYVWTAAGAMVNEALLRAGYAVVDIRPPNVKYADTLRAAARAAREGSAGLWATPAFSCPPAAFRRRGCVPGEDGAQRRPPGGNIRGRPAATAVAGGTPWA